MNTHEKHSRELQDSLAELGHLLEMLETIDDWVCYIIELGQQKEMVDILTKWIDERKEKELSWMHYIVDP